MRWRLSGSRTGRKQVDADPTVHGEGMQESGRGVRPGARAVAVPQQDEGDGDGPDKVEPAVVAGSGRTAEISRSRTHGREGQADSPRVWRIGALRTFQISESTM